MIGEPGELVKVGISELVPREFVRNLTKLRFNNEVGARLAPLSAEMNDFIADNGEFRARVLQQPAVEGTSQFGIRGLLSEDFAVYNGKPRLAFRLTDRFNQAREFAVYHDGASPPLLGIKDGREFRKVKLIFHDGIRLRVVYKKFREFNRSTIYTGDSSQLYSVNIGSSFIPHLRKESTAFAVDVKLSRKLEHKMLVGGTAYDHGRLGAEIAYTIARRLLKLEEVIIAEPSIGGKDLYTIDSRIAMQARLIFDFTQFRPLSMKEALSTQTGLLLRKLSQDFAYNASMAEGYAILSYVDSNRDLKSIVIKRSRFGPN
ncbi:MAG: hypothetical protein LYZ69_04270 [Nitrososphaerales archaeon]|nr:hypothetical protein [Nitrososphaerales archaeon]